MDTNDAYIQIACGFEDSNSLKRHNIVLKNGSFHPFFI